MPESCVVTIVDDGYEPGALALLNSLCRSGFRECVILYCRTSNAARHVKSVLDACALSSFNIDVTTYAPDLSHKDEMSQLGIT